MKLLDKTTLITGANRGFGLALAKRFWEEGSHLILVVRSESYISTLMREFKSHPKQNLEICVVDLSSEKEIRVFCQRKILLEKVDVLINNSALHGPIGIFPEVNLECWEQAFDLDFLVPVKLIHAITPYMLKRNSGKIINISGGGATGSRPGFTAYATAKTALVRLTEILAEEMPMLQINAIAPGAMKTRLLQELLSVGPELIGQTEYEKSKKLLEDENGHDQTMEKAVSLAVYLASEESGEISGKLISAVWDSWEKLHEKQAELKKSDIYTLRRIVPADREMNE